MIKPLPEKKVKDIEIPTKKFNTTDKEQEDGIRHFNKPSN